MENVIIIAVLAVILGSAGLYLYRARKRGVKCVGCSAGSNGCCSCSSHAKDAAASDCGCDRTGGIRT